MDILRTLWYTVIGGDFVQKGLKIAARYTLFDILPVMADSLVRRYRVAYHCHSSLELWYVFEGKLLHKVDGREYLQTPGSLVLVKPYTPHFIDTTVSDVTPIIFSASADEKALIKRGYDCFITHNKIAAANGRELPEFMLLRGKQKNDAEKIARKLLDEDCRKYPESLDVRCSLFADFLSVISMDLPELHISRTLRERTDAISDAVKYISMHFDEKISIDALAESALISKRRFTSNFKSVTGMTTGEVILLFRFLYAVQYLTFSDNTLEEIAQLIGFYDHPSFSHAFTEHFGMPPSEYRKRYRNESYSFESTDKLKRQRRYDILNYYYSLIHNGRQMPKHYVTYMPKLI